MQMTMRKYTMCNHGYTINFLKKLGIIISAIIVGAAISSLLPWNHEIRYYDSNVFNIMLYNIIIATFVIPFGKIVAGTIFVVNALYLGFALMGSMLSVGVLATLQLTVVHVPLEILAWIIAWILAERVGKFLENVVIHKERYSNVKSVLCSFCHYVVTIAIYGVAAIAEYCELHLMVS